MRSVIVFDCEFLTSEGAPTRFWCGPQDPDPIVVQIGAVRMGLEGDFPFLDTFKAVVAPLDRTGAPVELDPLFVRLTGITQDNLSKDGQPLSAVLSDLTIFAGQDRLWSWGKDEFNMIAISCYVAGLAPPLPVERFGNATTLCLQAGMPYDDIKATRSDRLSAYFNLEHPPLRGHDALDDARSVAYALQHLLQSGKLSPEACR